MLVNSKTYRFLFFLSFMFVFCQKNENINDTNINQNKVSEIINHLYNPSKDYVMVASHRGNWQKAPENTLAAIESCIALGVDIVEIDIRKTKDNQLVVIHDSDLNRTTNGHGKVKDKTLAEIKKLFIKNRFGSITKQKAPTLREAMLTAKGKILVMIDKANDYFEKTLEVLKSTETLNHAVFIEPYQYDEAKQVLSEELFEKAHYIPRIKENVDNVTRYITPFISNKDATAFELRFSKESSRVLNIMPTIKKAKVSIWVTTLASDMCANHTDKISLTKPDEGWGWCISRGANILLTDYPELMINYLKNEGLHEL